MTYPQTDVTPELLDFWIENGMNVLMSGMHGVGKTAKIKEAFDRHELQWRYFSAATMDPWTDLVGVPKEKISDDGKSILQFVLPPDFAYDSVEAIFLDEYNRAPTKVRNAVMELMQFKTINGRPFKNLKLIWAAVNPKESDDLNFDVEEIDPAQEDRFHVQVEIPYLPDRQYFSNMYGEEMAQAACDWWESLSNDIKKMVSPRRLDYALHCYRACGNIRHMLPQEANVAQLYKALSFGSPEEKFKKMMDENNTVEAKKFLAHENNLAAIQKLITEDEAAREFALPLIPSERISGLIAQKKEIKQEVFKRPGTYIEVIRCLAEGSQNRKLRKEAIAVFSTLTNDEGEVDEDKVKQIDDQPDFFIRQKPLSDDCYKSEQLHFKHNFKIKDEFSTFAQEEKDSENETSIDDSIHNICSKLPSATNTHLKDKRYVEATELLEKFKLTANQSKKILKIINWYVANANVNSVNSKTSIPTAINTCIYHILSEDSNFDIPDLFDLIPHVFYRFFGDNACKPEDKSMIQNLAFSPKPKSQQTNRSKLLSKSESESESEDHSQKQEALVQ